MQLFRRGLAGAGVAALADGGAVLLDTSEQFQGHGWAVFAAVGFQAHAHDPMQQQGEETDQRMRADSLGQPVVNRGDFDLALQHPETALDVRQRFVALDNLRGAEVCHVGEQDQLAVETLGADDRVFTDLVGEAISLVVDLESG